MLCLGAQTRQSLLVLRMGAATSTKSTGTSPFFLTPIFSIPRIAVPLASEVSSRLGPLIIVRQMCTTFEMHFRWGCYEQRSTLPADNHVFSPDCCRQNALLTDHSQPVHDEVNEEIPYG